MALTARFEGVDDAKFNPSMESLRVFACGGKPPYVWSTTIGSLDHLTGYSTSLFPPLGDSDMCPADRLTGAVIVLTDSLGDSVARAIEAFDTALTVRFDAPDDGIAHCAWSPAGTTGMIGATACGGTAPYTWSIVWSIESGSLAPLTGYFTTVSAPSGPSDTCMAFALVGAILTATDHVGASVARTIVGYE